MESTTGQSIMQFEEYCKFRSSMQMQLMFNGRTTNVFAADDPMFAGLILMEQQWQYACRISSVPQFNRGLQLPNVLYNQSLPPSAPCVPALNLHQSSQVKAVRARRPAGQKRKIKKYEGKPKKPLTSFMLYLKDFRKTLRHPPGAKTSPHEINKLAGKQWHLLPEITKHQYKNAAAKALAKWQEENFLSPHGSSVKHEMSSSNDANRNIQGSSGSKKSENSSSAKYTRTLTSSDSSSSSDDSSGTVSDQSSN